MRNRRHLLLIVALAGLLAIGFAGASCKKIKHGLGIGTTVSEAEEGTPEGTLHQAMTAALDKDAERGWRAFRKLLHSEEHNNIALRDWETLRFKRMRKQVHLYVSSEDPVTFEVRRIEERPNGAQRVFIYNSGNPENPTPCQLLIDEKQGGRWRIKYCSL